MVIRTRRENGLFVTRCREPLKGRPHRRHSQPDTGTHGSTIRAVRLLATLVVESQCRLYSPLKARLQAVVVVYWSLFNIMLLCHLITLNEWKRGGGVINMMFVLSDIDPYSRR